MLVIGLALSHQVLAVDQKTIYKAKFYNKDFSIQNDGSYLINNKKAGALDFYDSASTLSVYKGDINNIVAVKVERDTMGTNKHWNIINLATGKNIYAVFNSSLMREFTVNNKKISALIADESCAGIESPFVESQPDSSQLERKYYVYHEPYFGGFLDGDKQIYSNWVHSTLSCEQGCAEDCSWGPVYSLDIIAFSKNLNNVYFSGGSKNWTAYYAYDIKLNKITKTTLAKINKDKIRLSVVKDTGSKTSFKSSYFTLSFDLPTGFEVKEDKNHIFVYKAPYATREIGDDNTFFKLTRYDKTNTKASKTAYYDELLSNQKTSKIVLDGSTFTVLEGNGSNSFEGYNPDKVVVVFFDASWLEVIERPMNEKQTFDPILIGKQILSSFKFSK